MIETIRNGSASLTASTIGATLMEWDPGFGRNVLAGYYTEDELRSHDGFRSAILAPWVNRLENAQWRDSRGSLHSVRDQAGPEGLHGLASLLDFEVKNTGSALEYRGFIAASDAYPADISVLARYALGSDGVLQVNISALNVSGPEVPVAIGWHPYFDVTDRNTARIRVFGNTRVRTDSTLIPLPGEAAYEDIACLGNDLSSNGDFAHFPWSTISEDDDYSITNLHYNQLGIAIAQMETGYGVVTMMATSNTPSQAAFHVFSGSTLSRGSDHNVALEPVTAIANSFNRDDVFPHILLGKDGVRTLDVRVRYTMPEN